MIITEVEALHLRQPDVDPTIADGSQDALIIRVHTDTGLIGLGEVDSMPSVIKAVVDAPPSHRLANGLRSLLIGQDPLDRGALWQRMYEGSLYYGRRGAVTHAISGIDIALWDLAGKAAGLPIHQLLGGARRRSVRAYASTLMPSTPSACAQTVRQLVGQGFTAVKLGYGPLGQDPELDVALVAAARDAAGQEVDLMLDVGLGWRNTRVAIEVARRLQRYRLSWIEEPFFPDEHGKYAALAAAIDTPLAAGEQEATEPDFARLITECGVEIVQPDVTRAGGITEVMKIADLAHRRGRRTVLHAWSTGIIKAASLHVTAAMAEAELFEYCVQTTPLNERLVVQDFPLHDGEVSVPTGPGLGVELDLDVLGDCLVEDQRLAATA